MLHTHDGVEADAELGGCCDALQRSICGGQDFFRGKYVNNAKETKSITLTCRYPGGKIIPIELDGSYQSSTANGGMVLKKGAWTASIGRSIEFGVRVANNLAGSCCAGQGFILATMRGSGTAFLNGGGTVLECHLRAGERIVVDTFALVACDATVDVGARRAGSWTAMCCGGEGLFVAELTGPGRVIIQSMPVETAAAEYYRYMPKNSVGALRCARARARFYCDFSAALHLPTRAHLRTHGFTAALRKSRPAR
jgi:uncharacterized protein (AIM24 family)